MMTDDGPDPFTNLFEAPAKFARALFAPMAEAAGGNPLSAEDMRHWADVGMKLQSMWLEYQTEQLADPQALAPFLDPTRWMELAQDWYRQMPLADPAQQQALMQEGMALWQQVLGQYGLSPEGQPVAEGEPDLPRSDRRFADPRWRAPPAYALIHQTYLFLAERVADMVDKMEGLSDDKREQLRFTTRTITEAASPSNFPLLNPVVMERTLETRGDNLVRGMEHLLADLRRGQLSHTDDCAFTLGENIGDLGGLSIAVTAYEIALGGEPAPVLDGLTGLQRVFFGWSQVWRTKARDEEAIRRLAVDPHSPPEFRCNGVVRNLDSFHEAFDVRPGDGLYLEPDQRVKIW